MSQLKILLNDSEMPKSWYNLAADLSAPLPFLGPDGKPLNPQILETIFPKNLIEQEMSRKRWFDIPQEVISILCRWRPSPLRRAIYLERYLKTPAKIYFKDESVSPSGSHKTNTSVAQVWYNKKLGVKKLTTETGAGQWGTALSLACHLFGLECKIYMVRASFDQKPMRKVMTQIWGGKCVASPSSRTYVGRQILRQTPQTPGSLGIAISEAVEEAVSDKSGKTRYAIGSVLNHVLLHQTIIGLEAKKQFNKIGVKRPDIVIGCIGGGSNFAGLAFPFVYDKLQGEKIEIIPVESDACPKMTRGEFAYDYIDAAGRMPLSPMHTLGHQFIPPTIYAGGLRYHGMAPLVSQAIVEGLMRPQAVGELQSYEAAILWARTEGFIIAPETGYALACVIEEAKKAKKEGKKKVILFNLSGHGLLDLVGYEKYLSGKLENSQVSDQRIQKSLRPLRYFGQSSLGIRNHRV